MQSLYAKIAVCAVLAILVIAILSLIDAVGQSQIIPPAPLPAQYAKEGGADNTAETSAGTESFIQALKSDMQKLLPLHKKMPPPRPGDWLSAHPDEPGQTFDEYLHSDPVTLRHRRNVLYIQPVGDFNETQQKILDQTAAFMAVYFNCKVTVMEHLPISVIPKEYIRTHPTWGMRQIYTHYILDNLLIKRLPKDAVSLIALTTMDLYPDPDWNFVFGQASLQRRVGVWSMYRFGDPETEFLLCLLRTIGTASHETGHMFSIYHETEYLCNMNGSNSLQEGDRYPLWLCPNNMAKICFATGADPIKRYEGLLKFCKENDLTAEAEFYQKSIDALKE